MFILRYIQTAIIKLNLSIEYPSPYEHLVWDYNRANIENIKKFIESVNWEAMFNNKSVHKQVSIFSEILMNMFSNFTPNKLVTFDDRYPPWKNDFIKSIIKWKNKVCKIYTKNGYKHNDYL